MHHKTFPADAIHKDVIVVGNGPSGIALSFMLSGNIPYLTTADHPDEILAARLRPSLNQPLVRDDLRRLADGLEGRSSNPISLLLDSLVHPCADLGFEMEPLVEWRKDGAKIDHLVLGKGPPGGSWHSMDPHILTLSLASWMALPGLPYESRDSSEKRAFASNVAAYYERYVASKNLGDNFRNGVVVTNIKYIGNSKVDIPKEGDVEMRTSCSLSEALGFIFSEAQKKCRSERCGKRARESTSESTEVIISKNEESLDSWGCKQCEKLDSFRRKKNTMRSISCSFDPKNEPSGIFKFLRYSPKFSFNFCSNPQISSVKKRLWFVEAVDVNTGERLNYTCENLVLANGSSDCPNRLQIETETCKDPSWLLHDVKTLENELDCYLQENSMDRNPVMVVGAGLSAADAIIAARARNVPVIHVFRKKSSGLNKHLPENMYPEYHKVAQMMEDGGAAYSLYEAYPKHTLTSVSESKRTVILTSNKNGKTLEMKVSFAAILIGSRPKLNFFQEWPQLGVKKGLAVDTKNNPVDVDKSNHRVNGFQGLYAIGPLAGDNFVRFLPGGALAVVSDLYRRYEL